MADKHPTKITKQRFSDIVQQEIERLETLRILADPKVMAAIRKHREGRAKYHDVAALDEL